jgi:hypothetical protein
MVDPNYQEVLLRLLALWELYFAKLEGRRPRTVGQGVERPACARSKPGPIAMKQELTKGQYLSQRIERAVEPLARLLHESDLRFIKIILEERLRTDPQLSRLADRAARRFRQ